MLRDLSLSKNRNPMHGFLNALMRTIKAFFVSAMVAATGATVRFASRIKWGILMAYTFARTWADLRLSGMKHSNLARSEIGALSVNTIIGFVVIAVVLAVLFPFIISTLTGVDTSGWDPMLVTIWDFLPIILGVGILIGVVTYWLKKN